METSEARQLLQAERTRIESTLAALRAAANEDRETSAHDQADITQAYEASIDVGRREQLEDELRALERAEQRLAEGGYGLSVESGEPIPDGRLRAQPTAERTVAEQQRFAG